MTTWRNIRVDTYDKSRRLLYLGISVAAYFRFSDLNWIEEEGRLLPTSFHHRLVGQRENVHEALVSELGAAA